MLETVFWSALKRNCDTGNRLSKASTFQIVGVNYVESVLKPTRKRVCHACHCHDRGALQRVLRVTCSTPTPWIWTLPFSWKRLYMTSSLPLNGGLALPFPPMACVDEDVYPPDCERFVAFEAWVGSTFRKEVVGAILIILT